jgi:hypothetical protein
MNIYIYIIMNSDTKEQLINNIKEWVNIDNELKQYQKDMKLKKDKKKKLTNIILNVMKDKEIDGIDINGGKLIYSQNKVKGVINKKTLLTCLDTYFKNDSKKVEDLTNYILENREIKISETIRRKIEK